MKKKAGRIAPKMAGTTVGVPLSTFLAVLRMMKTFMEPLADTQLGSGWFSDLNIAVTRLIEAVESVKDNLATISVAKRAELGDKIFLAQIVLGSLFSISSLSDARESWPPPSFTSFFVQEYGQPYSIYGDEAIIEWTISMLHQFGLVIRISSNKPISRSLQAEFGLLTKLHHKIQNVRIYPSTAKNSQREYEARGIFVTDVTRDRETPFHYQTAADRQVRLKILGTLASLYLAFPNKDIQNGDQLTFVQPYRSHDSRLALVERLRSEILLEIVPITLSTSVFTTFMEIYGFTSPTSLFMQPDLAIEWLCEIYGRQLPPISESFVSISQWTNLLWYIETWTTRNLEMDFLQSFLDYQKEELGQTLSLPRAADSSYSALQLLVETAPDVLVKVFQGPPTHARDEILTMVTECGPSIIEQLDPSLHHIIVDTGTAAFITFATKSVYGRVSLGVLPPLPAPAGVSQLSNDAGAEELSFDVYQDIYDHFMHSPQDMWGRISVQCFFFWDFPRYIDNEGIPASSISSVLTVSGNASRAKAASCSEYLRNTWQCLYSGLLMSIEDALTYGTGSESYKAPTGSVSIITRNKTLRGGDILQVDLSGEKESVVSVIQQLTWLTTAFRVAEEDHLSLSHATLRFFDSGSAVITLLPLFRPKTSANQEGVCWHPLFQGFVMSPAPRIAAAPNFRGIELPFDVMTTLAGIRYPVEHADGLLLKGASTMLIPASSTGSGIQWHLVHNSDGTRVSTQAGLKNCLNWFQTRDFRVLSTSTAFLGAWKSAGIYLGTVEMGTKLFDRSGADLENRSPEIARELTAALNAGFKGFVGGGISGKVLYPKRRWARLKQEDDEYWEDQLERSKFPVILYDRAAQRGWLVPGLSLILQMALAYVELKKQSVLPAFLEDLPYAEVSGDGGTAAFDVIVEYADAVVRNSPRIGQKPQMFADVVGRFLRILEKQKDEALEDLQSGGKALRSNGLCGLEFADIVEGSYIGGMKEIKSSSRPRWWDIARCPGVVTILANNVGNIIRPDPHTVGRSTCATWATTPEKYQFLTASIPCLKSLSLLFTGQSSCSSITATLKWHQPDPQALFCDCPGSDCTCNPLQELRKKGWRDRTTGPGKLPLFGAVIFGRKEQGIELLKLANSGIESGNSSRPSLVIQSTSHLPGREPRQASSSSGQNGQRYHFEPNGDLPMRRPVLRRRSLSVQSF